VPFSATPRFEVNLDPSRSREVVELPRTGTPPTPPTPPPRRRAVRVAGRPERRDVTDGEYVVERRRSRDATRELMPLRPVVVGDDQRTERDGGEARRDGR
jgi:hypothetical protein